MRHVIKRLILWGLLGALTVPVLGFLIAALSAAFDPRCGTPGDSGGCAMGLVTIPIALILPGMGLFMIVALVRTLLPRLRNVAIADLARTLWRRGRQWPYSD